MAIDDLLELWQIESVPDNLDIPIHQLETVEDNRVTYCYRLPVEVNPIHLHRSVNSPRVFEHHGRVHSVLKLMPLALGAHPWLHRSRTTTRRTYDHRLDGAERPEELFKLHVGDLRVQLAGRQSKWTDSVRQTTYISDVDIGLLK